MRFGDDCGIVVLNFVVYGKRWRNEKNKNKIVVFMKMKKYGVNCGLWKLKMIFFFFV